ncbi:Ral guanine nucleotide dissociation stimulator-like 2 [Bagarius yarrelli]|uniref:Ral guanine nucleotide dissociation stimulator-like 2 n=1 Tax=Bagarius yarrelli TaxID=175774 RepID=A0A556TLP1_BAGYA|nr:Ral guanine nucleotide dissociation stimulator-like 2 [Bagarius yarrelli]
MLHRSMRTAGVELPEVGSKDVPLIGYRPLAPDADSPPRQMAKDADARERSFSQVEASPMKTTWYCPLDLSTVSEKEEEGIIYTVIVKPQHGDTITQIVKAGTEEKLVLHLLHSFSMEDTSFISIFLSTYRSFTTTERVLDILTDRLVNPPGDGSSATRQTFNKAVCSVFSTWLGEYPEDFHSLRDPSLLLRLAPLMPNQTGSEVKSRLLKIAEKLSDQSLIPESTSDLTSNSLPPTPHPNPLNFDATNILAFPSTVIAEQLTKIETELFLKLVPYHCLGSLWSQRDKKGREGVCWSVRATVRQFNRLANAVTASCLWQTELKTQQRTRLLEKWISVAEACRIRKNFSSLYAIVSALQSNPIHRLRKTWQETDRVCVCVCVCVQSSAQGTVPYLGIFLTDLTMLDAAVKDRLENGYINFDKRRREFEVLAKIRLLQSSCRNSAFRLDESFVHWYDRVPTLSAEESDPAPSPVITPNNTSKTHRRSVSCGNAPSNQAPGAGPEMRIVKIRMDLRDGNLYRSILVSSNDKSPTVISSALEKHNQDPREASKYELIQLLPEGKELTIPATGNVFYAMSSASVDFLLRRRGGNTPLGSPSLNNETSATFPRIKAKGRRLVRTLF